MLSLDENQSLVGPLPETLDLRNFEFPRTQVFIHGDEEFNAAEAAGRPVQPNLFVADDANVEVLYFPSDEVGIDYAVIENLPNLRELHVCRKGTGRYWQGELQWLTCQNLPKLEKLTIDGDLVWIDLSKMDDLKEINVSRCKKLDHFSIVEAPKLSSLNVRGCVKLRQIIGLDNAEQEHLAVASQIQRTQMKSRGDRKFYKNMTYSDIDLVLETINEGVKAACRNGDYYLSAYEPDTPCNGKESDAKFKPYRFDLLRPLEAVYTGGTGETYPYSMRLIQFDWKDQKEWCCSSTGNSSQEECLDYALECESMGMLRVPNRPKPTNRQIYAFLIELAATIPLNFRRVRKIFIHDGLIDAHTQASYAKQLDALDHYQLVSELSADVDLCVVPINGDSTREIRKSHPVYVGHNLIDLSDLDRFISRLAEDKRLQSAALFWQVGTLACSVKGVPSHP